MKRKSLIKTITLSLFTILVIFTSCKITPEKSPDISSVPSNSDQSNLSDTSNTNQNNPTIIPTFENISKEFKNSQTNSNNDLDILEIMPNIPNQPKDISIYPSEITYYGDNIFYIVSYDIVKNNNFQGVKKFEIFQYNIKSKQHELLYSDDKGYSRISELRSNEDFLIWVQGTEKINTIKSYNRKTKNIETIHQCKYPPALELSNKYLTWHELNDFTSYFLYSYDFANKKVSKYDKIIKDNVNNSRTMFNNNEIIYKQDKKTITILNLDNQSETNYTLLESTLSKNPNVDDLCSNDSCSEDSCLEHTTLSDIYFNENYITWYTIDFNYTTVLHYLDRKTNKAYQITNEGDFDIASLNIVGDKIIFHANNELSTFDIKNKTISKLKNPKAKLYVFCLLSSDNKFFIETRRENRDNIIDLVISK